MVERHHFLCKQNTFNSASVLLNFFMLLNIYNHHDIETHFIFDIFMLYLCDLFCVVINHTTSFEQTHMVFVHYLEYLLLFVDNNVGEKSE